MPSMRKPIWSSKTNNFHQEKQLPSHMFRGFHAINFRKVPKSRHTLQCQPGGAGETSSTATPWRQKLSWRATARVDVAEQTRWRHGESLKLWLGPCSQKLWFLDVFTIPCGFFHVLPRRQIEETADIGAAKKSMLAVGQRKTNGTCPKLEYITP
jgi:hypothetical protein